MGRVSDLVVPGGAGRDVLGRLLADYNGHITDENIEPHSLNPAYVLKAASITQALLGNDSVGAAQIQADAVGASEIAADAVGTSEIGTLPGMRVVRTTAQTIPNNAIQNVTWQTTTYSSDVTLVSASTTLQLNTAGVYVVGANVQWDATGGGGGPRIAGINWYPTGGGGPLEIGRQSNEQPNAAAAAQSVCTIKKFAAGDQLRLFVYQASGANLNLNAANVAGDELVNMAVAWVSD